jgi:hypothetical protein
LDASYKGKGNLLKAFRRHPLVLAALLAALFVRGLVPEGFMPAQGELVEFCTLHGPRVMLTDPLTGELLDAEEGRQSAPPCPWSLLLTTLATPTLPACHVITGAAPRPEVRPTQARSTRASLALPPVRAPPSRS